jgi:hypothetical protein
VPPSILTKQYGVLFTDNSIRTSYGTSSSLCQCGLKLFGTILLISANRNCPKTASTYVKSLLTFYRLLREVSARVKALRRIRDFLEEIFGADDEGHDRIDSFRLAKLRLDVHKWEQFIAECYLVLRAMRGPCEALGSLYQEVAAELNGFIDEPTRSSAAGGGGGGGGGAPVDAGIVGAESRSYKDILKTTCLDLTIILDNFDIPQGW